MPLLRGCPFTRVGRHREAAHVRFLVSSAFPELQGALVEIKKKPPYRARGLREVGNAVINNGGPVWFETNAVIGNWGSNIHRPGRSPVCHVQRV